MRQHRPTIFAAAWLAVAACGGGDDGGDAYRGPVDDGATGGYGATTGYADTPATGTSGGSREAPADPIPVAAAPDRVAVVRTLVVDGNAATRLVDRAQLHVEGYTSAQLDSTGLPREGSVPNFRWSDPELARSWPQRIPTSVPADGTVQLVAYLDLNGTGRLDTGDRCSLPADPLPIGADEAPGDTIELRIDRIYVSVSPTPPAGVGDGAYARDGGARGDDGSTSFGPGYADRAADDDDGDDAPGGDRGGPGEGGPGGPPGGPDGGPDGPDDGPDEDPNPPRPVTLEASSADVAAITKGAILLLGFRGEDVSALGIPKPEATPVWAWSRPRSSLTWPVVVRLRVPDHPNLHLFPIVDVDGDGALAHGDWFGVPPGKFEPPGDMRQPILFGIDRSFESMEYAEGVVFSGKGVTSTTGSSDGGTGSSRGGRDSALAGPGGPGSDASEAPSGGCGG